MFPRRSSEAVSAPVSCSTVTVSPAKSRLVQAPLNIQRSQRLLQTGLLSRSNIKNIARLTTHLNIEHT